MSYKARIKGLCPYRGIYEEVVCAVDAARIAEEADKEIEQLNYDKNKQIEGYQAEIAVFKNAIEEVRELINNSAGIVDIGTGFSPWHDLEEGGFFEDCLEFFRDAEELLKQDN